MDLVTASSGPIRKHRQPVLSSSSIQPSGHLYVSWEATRPTNPTANTSNSCMATSGSGKSGHTLVVPLITRQDNEDRVCTKYSPASVVTGQSKIKCNTLWNTFLLSQFKVTLHRLFSNSLHSEHATFLIKRSNDMFAGFQPTDNLRHPLPGSSPGTNGHPWPSLCPCLEIVGWIMHFSKNTSHLESSSQAVALLSTQVAPLKAQLLQTWQLLQQKTQDPLSL